MKKNYTMVLVIGLWTGCGGGGVGDLCSSLAACGAGGSQFCKNGSSCFYQLTDGSKIDCVDCGNCQDAASALADWCDGIKPPDLGHAPAFIPVIPKTGTPYTGPTSDPKLSTPQSCPDTTLEPNNTISTATDVQATVDAANAFKLVRLSICPVGAGDLDMFHVTSTRPGTTLMAEIFYDISYGDLDVAILDSSGAIIASDGSTNSNGCITSPLGVGEYYVAVAGANNAVNRYDARIRLFSQPQFCP